MSSFLKAVFIFAATLAPTLSFAGSLCMSTNERLDVQAALVSDSKNMGCPQSLTVPVKGQGESWVILSLASVTNSQKGGTCVYTGTDGVINFTVNCLN